MLPDFFIRCDGKFVRIDTKDIRYLESLKNYVRIVTVSRTYMALISMNQLEKELPVAGFCRVHRSFIVSLQHINSFDSESVYLHDITIPISPAYRHALPEKVKVLVSETRSRINVEN